MDIETMPAPHVLPFGRRHVVPRICVVENKPHVRSFLAQAFEDLGFVTCDCPRAEVPRVLAEFVPDLIVVGPLTTEGELALFLRSLTQDGFAGRVMLFGGRSSLTLPAAQEFGEQLGLAMLPPLGTPFRDGDLAENLQEFLPILPLPSVPVDVGEALDGGWIELWYQSVIDTRAMTARGASAVIRVRHPSWGVVPPANFITEPDDPRLERLSRYVVSHALADWDTFTAVAPIELSVGLPLPALLTPGFIEDIFLALSDRAMLNGLMIEIAADEAARDVDGFRRAVDALAACRIRAGLDRVRAVHLPLLEAALPVVKQIKLDRDLIGHGAKDRRSRDTAAKIVKLARMAGARSVADGVDQRSDFQLAREIAADAVQGVLLAKPVDPRRFLRTVSRQAPRAQGGTH
jgi:EAL domain-containing protein (putative c-di-GMP-specific phosphodiesterase class I)